jgi:hypothetical protein
MLDPAKELAIRTALGTKVAALTGSVFIRPELFDSEQDWVEKLGVQNVDGELELKYCTVNLLQFTDSPTDGCDDDPVVFLTYQIHIFDGFTEQRSDLSNSTDDFIAKILDLRNEFLESSRNVAGVDKADYTPLTQSSLILLGDDPLTGGFGHFTDLQQRVQVV